MQLGREAKNRSALTLFDTVFFFIYYQYMPTTLLLPRIRKAIQNAKPEEQRQLLAQLPRLLKLDAADFAWLKIAEDSFNFWNNADDALYDAL